MHRFEKAGRRVAVVMRRRLRPLPERPPLRGLSVPIDPIFLRHFSDRLRLRSSDFDQEAIRSASGRMKDILAKKNVTGTRAAKAIAETLHLAASVTLAERRRDMARHRIDVGQRATDELCRRLDSFVDEVAELPPNSKHLLNQSVERPLACGFFDTGIFFLVLDALSASLSAISPEVRASAAHKALFDGDGVSREPSSQSSTKLLWEELDAETRRECEKAIEAKLPKSSLLFRMLADAFVSTHLHSRQEHHHRFSATTLDPSISSGTSSVLSKGAVVSIPAPTKSAQRIRKVRQRSSCGGRDRNRAYLTGKFGRQSGSGKSDTLDRAI